MDISTQCEFGGTCFICPTCGEFDLKKEKFEFRTEEKETGKHSNMFSNNAR